MEHYVSTMNILTDESSLAEGPLMSQHPLAVKIENKELGPAGITNASFVAI